MSLLDWTPADEAPTLVAGEAHLWRMATLPGGGDGDARLLSAEENERARRLRRAEERRRFVAGRAALRRVLAPYVDAPPTALRFRYGDHGKPFLSGPHGARCSFSVTHAGDLLLVAVAAGPAVGVDVERLREVRRWRRIAERHFAPEVCAVLEGLAEEDAAVGFVHAWTGLEAYAKACGGGVYATRSHLPLPWPPADGGVVVHDLGPGATGTPWTLRVLRPADGFVATVAVEGAVEGFRFFEGPPR